MGSRPTQTSRTAEKKTELRGCGRSSNYTLFSEASARPSESIPGREPQRQFGGGEIVFLAPPKKVLAAPRRILRSHEASLTLQVGSVDPPAQMHLLLKKKRGTFLVNLTDGHR